jgi:hypothetical protein
VGAEMNGLKNIAIRISLWCMYFIITLWALSYILRHHSIQSDERKWLRSFGGEVKVSGADKNRSTKPPDGLTFYKTLPKEGVKP